MKRGMQLRRDDIDTRHREALQALVRSLQKTPVLSVYLDWSVPDPAQADRWRVELERCLADQREALVAAPKKERAAFERAVAVLLHRVRALKTTPKAKGWVAFVTPEGIRHEESLLEATPTQATWAVGARLAPYVEAHRDPVAAVFILLDSRKADLHRYRAGELRRLETIRARRTSGPVLHMGDAPRPGFHPGTRGAAGRDEVQRRRAAEVAQLHREVAERALALANADGWILVAGIPRDRAVMARSLAEAAPGRVLEVADVDIHASSAARTAAVRKGISALRAAADRQVVADLEEHAGPKGRAVFGEEATRQALDDRRAAAVYFTAGYAAGHRPALETAIHAALAQHAAARELGDGAAGRLDDHGGIGARLRH